ncbi:MAG: YwaF family protein [Clostridia bacterium]|nr:YwaF family protein [Clostridia bacterium]
MKEFFGIGGYNRIPEGAYSVEHLVFVGSLLLIMVVLAVVLGKANRIKSEKAKNKVLIWSAILIDAFEIFKIVSMCVRAESLEPIRYELPLFLCSIQLITLPLAAFSKGRIKEAATDFVCIFGILGAVFGTIGAAQNYNAYPVLSLDNVCSGITHSISGFASLYIMFARLTTMKKKNIFITVSILLSFCVMAYIANILIDYNYMFLMNHDGTPYSIIYNLVGGHPVLYPLSVVALFLIYIALFYFIVHLRSKKQGTTVLEVHERKEITV